MAAVAEDIVRRTGVREGYCLDLGCGNGELALALAQQTKLQIVAVDADPENVPRRRTHVVGGRAVRHARGRPGT